MLSNTLFRANAELNQFISKLHICRYLNNANNINNSILYNKLKKNNVNNLLTAKQTNLAKAINDLAKTGYLRRFNRSGYYQNEYHLLTTVYSETGAIADMPKWYRLGIIKLIATIISFLMIGSMISKTTVQILEENDIFKPEDDDDDDDD